MRRHPDPLGGVGSDVARCVPNVSECLVEIAAMLQGAIGIGLDAAKRLDEGLNKLTVIRHNASSDDALQRSAPASRIMAGQR
jgi:hypothetical protein